LAEAIDEEVLAVGRVAGAFVHRALLPARASGARALPTAVGYDQREYFMSCEISGGWVFAVLAENTLWTELTAVCLAVWRIGYVSTCCATEAKSLLQARQHGYATHTYVTDTCPHQMVQRSSSILQGLLPEITS
jgi:hypothetical protein